MKIFFFKFIYFRSGVPKKGGARVIYGLDAEFPAVAVVNLGPDPEQNAGQYVKNDVNEERDTLKENLRCGVAGILLFLS